MPPRAVTTGRAALRAAQLAGDQLAFDLQPDHEEEQRHQPVVDPVAQVHGQAPAADLDGQLGVPQRLVGALPGRIRPYQGNGGGGQQDQAAGDLGVQELPQGPGQPPGHPAVAGAPGALYRRTASRHRALLDRHDPAVCRPGFPAHQVPTVPALVTLLGRSRPILSTSGQAQRGTEEVSGAKNRHHRGPDGPARGLLGRPRRRRQHRGPGTGDHPGRGHRQHRRQLRRRRAQAPPALRGHGVADRGVPAWPGRRRLRRELDQPSTHQPGPGLHLRPRERGQERLGPGPPHRRRQRPRPPRSAGRGRCPRAVPAGRLLVRGPAGHHVRRDLPRPGRGW